MAMRAERKTTQRSSHERFWGHSNIKEGKCFE